MRQPVLTALPGAKQLDDTSLVGIDGSLGDLDRHLVAPLREGMQNLVDVYFSVL
jgi:hypothetical protein